MGNVDTDPVALEFLSSDDGRATAAEGIEHEIAFAAVGLDNSLQQFERLLSWESQSLLCLRLNRVNIVPNILNWHARHFIQVSLVSWDSSGLRLNDTSTVIEFFHSLFAVPPVACDTKKFILRITFGSAARTCDVIQLISAPSSFFHIAVEAIDIFLVIGLIELIP